MYRYTLYSRNAVTFVFLLHLLKLKMGSIAEIFAGCVPYGYKKL